MRLLLFACMGIVRPFRAGGPLRCGQPGYPIIAPRIPHGRRSLIHATEDDVEEARRFLDLADDPDVERYLREGKSALGRQVALVLPRDDAGVEAAMMLAVLQQVHRLTLTLITTLTSTLTSTLTPTPNLNPNPNPNQVHRLAPLYLALPKLVPRLLKELLRAWSVGGSKETCLLAFAGIRQLAAEMPPPFIDTCLKGTYLAFAQACAPPPT